MPLFSRKDGDWLVTSRDNLRWQVRLGSCSREHAESVREQLEAEPTVPNNLYVKKVRR